MIYITEFFCRTWECRISKKLFSFKGFPACEKEYEKFTWKSLILLSKIVKEIHSLPLLVNILNDLRIS